MEQEILVPFGTRAGETFASAEVVRKFAGHISTYMAMLGSCIHDTESERDRELFVLEYVNLEAYVAILFAIYYQMEPGAWELHEHDGLIDLAREHDLVLPGWMKPRT